MNYLLAKKEQFIDADGKTLGPRVCDKTDGALFKVSDDFEWVQSSVDCDIYTGCWYWKDETLMEYIPPIIERIQQQPI